VEVYRSQGGLVGRLVGKDDGHQPIGCLRKVLGRSQATEEEFANTLVNVEAALNSRLITQDVEDVITPAYFLWCKTDDVVLNNRATKRW
jgi:hypothetical protein